MSATLSHPSSAATTVTVTGVSDFYTVDSDATVVIAAGQTANATDTATVAAVDDDGGQRGQPERDGDGHGVQRPGVGAVTGPSLTLTDDEETPTATLALSSSSISESGGVATVTASLSRASSAAGDADGGGFGERLHAVEREDTDRRIGADGEHGRGDRDGGRRHDGLAGQVGDGFGHGVGRQRGWRSRPPRRLTIEDDDDAPTVELALAAAAIAEDGARRR